MLPERSRIRTISVGFDAMSGDAARASVTFNVPEQSIWLVLTCLLELVIPIRFSFSLVNKKCVPIILFLDNQMVPLFSPRPQDSPKKTGPGMLCAFQGRMLWNLIQAAFSPRLSGPSSGR